MWLWWLSLVVVVMGQCTISENSCESYRKVLRTRLLEVSEPYTEAKFQKEVDFQDVAFFPTDGEDYFRQQAAKIEQLCLIFNTRLGRIPQKVSAHLQFDSVCDLKRMNERRYMWNDLTNIPIELSTLLRIQENHTTYAPEGLEDYVAGSEQEIDIAMWRSRKALRKHYRDSFPACPHETCSAVLNRRIDALQSEERELQKKLTPLHGPFAGYQRWFLQKVQTPCKNATLPQNMCWEEYWNVFYQVRDNPPQKTLEFLASAVEVLVTSRLKNDAERLIQFLSSGDVHCFFSDCPENLVRMKEVVEYYGAGVRNRELEMKGVGKLYNECWIFCQTVTHAYFIARDALRDREVDAKTALMSWFLMACDDAGCEAAVKKYIDSLATSSSSSHVLFGRVLEHSMPPDRLVFLLGVLLSSVFILASCAIFLFGRGSWKFNTQLLFIAAVLLISQVLSLAFWILAFVGLRAVGLHSLFDPRSNEVYFAAQTALAWTVGLSYTFQGIIFTVMLYQWVQALFALSEMKNPQRAEQIIRIGLVVLTICICVVVIAILISTSIAPTTFSVVDYHAGLQVLLFRLLSVWLFTVISLTLILCIMGLVKFEKAGRNKEERWAIVKSLALFFCVFVGSLWRVLGVFLRSEGVEGTNGWTMFVGWIFLMRGIVAEVLVVAPLLMLVAGGMYAHKAQLNGSEIIDLDESKVHLLDQQMSELDLSDGYVPKQYDDI